MIINQKSCHFKYYRWIRSIWALDIPEQTNLCVYTQCMFWLTAWSILALPFVITGYIPKKIAERYDVGDSTTPNLSANPMFSSVWGNAYTAFVGVCVFVISAAGLVLYEVCPSVWWFITSYYLWAIGTIILGYIGICIYNVFKEKICPLVVFDDSHEKLENDG